jgi:hypothetical protein
MILDILNSARARIPCPLAIPHVVLALCASVSAPCAWAYSGPLEGFLAQPTDAPSPSVFLLNPASFLPEGGFAFGLAEGIRNRSMRYVNNTATNTVTTKSKRREFAHAAGFMVAPGGGFGLGLTVKQHQEEVRSTNDNSRYDTLPVGEQLLRREAQARFVLEFTENFRIGGGFRYQALRADVLGSFNLPPEEFSSYKGTLYGAVLGAQMVFDGGGFGLAYLTPLRGKVEIQGESKVTTDAGLAQVAGHWQAAQPLSLGFFYNRWFHENDELAEETTGPNRANQTSISLLGLAPERRFLAIQDVGVGLDFRFAGKLGLRLTPSYEQGEYVRHQEPDPDVGQRDNAKYVSKSYRGKAALLVYDKSFELQAGIDYAPRTMKIADEDGTDTEEFKTEELNTFASVSVVF